MREPLSVCARGWKSDRMARLPQRIWGGPCVPSRMDRAICPRSLDKTSVQREQSRAQRLRHARVRTGGESVREEVRRHGGQKIRIRLKSYDHEVIDSSARKIVTLHSVLAPRSWPGAAADREERFRRYPVAPQVQGQPRALEMHAQAAHRHHRSDPKAVDLLMRSTCLRTSTSRSSSGHHLQ